MYCRGCGYELPQDVNVCQNCGMPQGSTKYCQHCGSVIDKECVVCPKCGKQVSELRQQPYQQPNIVINNANSNANTANAYGGYGRAKDKWIAFLLCLFLGFLGAHKFYEGKIGMGIAYICTGGLCGVGVLFDLIAILGKPNPYFV